MTKSLCMLLILSTCSLTACASQERRSYSASEKFKSDDCKSLSALFRDQSYNSTATTAYSEGGRATEKSKDKITMPWGRGGTNADKLSKERAALRKAHKQKGCAQ